MTKRLVAPVLAALALLAAAPASAAEPALDRLVSADTPVAVLLRDLPAQRERFGQTPLGRALADPEVSRFFAPLFSHPEFAGFLKEIEAQTGAKPSELLGFAVGDILFTIPSASFSLPAPGAEQTPAFGVLLALEVGDNQAKIAELLASAETKAAAPFAKEDYNGVAIRTFAAPEREEPVLWALHQGRWLVSNDRAPIAAALDALAAGGLSPALADAPAYVQAAGRAPGKLEMLAHADLAALYPKLMAAIEAKQAESAAEPNPFGAEPANIVRALGLDALRGFSITAATDGDTDHLVGAITYSEERGVVRLFAYRDGPVARPDWMPANWFNVSSQNFSVPDLYSEIEALLSGVSPMLGAMVQGQLGNYEKQLGVSLKDDLLGSLGVSFVSGFAPPAGTPAAATVPYEELEQVFAVSLADAGRFERTVEKLKAAFLPPGDAGPLQKRDYLGRSLYSVTPPMGAKGFAYAISDGWLLVSVGSAGPVESVIQLQASPKADASFWNRADVRAATAHVPDRAFSVQYSDLATLFASLAATAAEWQSTQPEDEPRLVDPAAAPSRETLARHLKGAVSHGERTAEGLFFKTATPAR